MSNRIVSWEKDPVTWRYVSVSPRAEELLGYALKAWYSENFWELRLHPDDWQAAVDYYRQATQIDENYQLEYRMVAADGDVVWIRDHFSIEMEDPKPKLMRGILIDITDEKQAEKTKHDSSILFEQIARLANMGHWEWDELKDRLISCSTEYARIYGLTVEECCTQVATLDEDLELIHPDDRASYARARYNYRRDNMHGSNSSKNLDAVYRLVTKKGDVRYIQELAEPVFDERGQHVRSVGTIQDITERKLMELELQESEKRLRVIIENMPTAIHLKDGQGRYELVNSKFCAWFGGTSDNVIGKTFGELVNTPEQVKLSIAHEKESMETGDTILWEAPLTTPDGEEKTILAHKFPISGPDGRITSVGGVDVDITDLKHTEAKNIRLGRIIEQSLNEVFCFNVDTLLFEEVNRGARENLGYTLEELRTMTPVSIKPEFTHESFTEMIQPLRDGKIDQLVFETVHQRKDGSTYDAEAHLQLIPDGEKPVFAAIVQDVTEKKRAERELMAAHEELELRVHERTAQLRDEVEERKNIEAALRESERRVRDYAESSADWFWEMGPDLKFNYISDRFETITGEAQDQLIGKTRKDVAIPDNDPEKWESHYDDLNNHRPFRDLEYQMKRMSGGFVNVRISGNPIFNDDGDFMGYRGTGSDITAQVEAEKRAETAEHQLADAIDGLNQGIVLYDADERFVICNTKYREVVKEISDLLVPGVTIAEIARASFERGIVSGWDNADDWVEARLERFRGEFDPVIHQLRNGQWIMTAEHKTRNESTLIIRTDVTELKEAQLQLEAAKNAAEEASNFKSNFLANMSHELRTPLNAIIGFTDIMRKQSLGPMGNGRYQEYAEDIHRSGQHLLALIDDILDLSAIEAGKLELNKTPFNVAEVIDDSATLIAQHAKEKNIEVSVLIDDGLPPVLADRRRLMQVLINLLTNAVKFSLEGGKVSIKALRYGKQERQAGLEIIISDTGIGMDEHDVDLAMSKFGRANSRVTREIEGTGLGLPLSKRLVELHGAEFDLSSKLGEGTAVSIRFPADTSSVS